MMDISFQEILVFAIVFAAASYGGYKTFKQFVAGDEQEKCTKCGCAGKEHHKPINKKNHKIPAHFFKDS